MIDPPLMFVCSCSELMALRLQLRQFRGNSPLLLGMWKNKIQVCDIPIGLENFTGLPWQYLERIGGINALQTALRPGLVPLALKIYPTAASGILQQQLQKNPMLRIKSLTLVLCRRLKLLKHAAGHASLGGFRLQQKHAEGSKWQELEFGNISFPHIYRDSFLLNAPTYSAATRNASDSRSRIHFQLVCESWNLDTAAGAHGKGHNGNKSCKWS